MAEPKIQRSFYLTEEHSRWLKVTAAERGISNSALLAELIDATRAPKTTSPAKVKADGQNIHSVLAKVAKQ